MLPRSCRSFWRGPSLPIGRLAGYLLVREGELVSVGYFVVFFVLLGGGMALGRGTTDALFFKRYGIEYLPLMYVGLSLLLALVSTGYAAFVDRMPPERFFRFLFVAVILALVASWVTMAFSGATIIYPAYFLLYEVTSELMLVHGALYVAQNLDTLQAKRLSPLIFAGFQVGTLLGGLGLALLAQRIGTQNVLLVWGLLLTAGIGVMALWHRRHGASPYFRAPRRARNQLREAWSQVTQGLRFTRDSALLRSSALAMFFMVIMFYVLSYSVNRVYTETFDNETSLTAFFGWLLAGGSALSLFLQIFVTNRVIDRFGVRRVNLLFPVTSLISYLALITHFALPAAILASVNKDAIMAAFRNPVHSMFFNILPHFMQGRARAMGVAVVMPLALMVCGGVLWFAQRFEDPSQFLLPGLAATALFLYYSRRMNVAYVDALVENLKDHLFLPDGNAGVGLRDGGEDVFQTLARGVDHHDESVAVTYARTLVAAFPGRATERVLARAATASQAGLDQLFRLVASLEPGAVRGFMMRNGESGDDHFKATCLATLFVNRDPSVKERVAWSLRSDNPRLIATGICGVLRYPVTELHDEAMAAWGRLLAGGTGERLAALDLLGELELLPRQVVQWLRREYAATVHALLQETNTGVLGRVLKALPDWTGSLIPELGEDLRRLAGHADPALRAGAVMGARLLPRDPRALVLREALEDGHQKVRQAAVVVMRENEQQFLDDAVACLTHTPRGSPRAQQTLLEALLEQGLPRPVIKRISHEKTQDARRLYGAWKALEGFAADGAPALQLLRITLAERVRQMVALALTALQSVSDPSTIAVLRAGLDSADPRYVANACEALRNLDDRTAKALGEILEGRDCYAPVEDKGLPFTRPEQVLEWCGRHDDGWLRTCAQAASRTLQEGADLT